MASWYSKELGDGVEAFAPTSEIQSAFLSLTLAQAGTVQYSRDAAIFHRYDLESNVVTIFFTPSAHLLARTFGATPCERPVPTEDFRLVAGDDRTWEVHFPGFRERHRSSS